MATVLLALQAAAQAPVITRQPIPVSAYEGTSVTFEVQATGENLNYRWLYKGNSTGHPSAPTLTLTDLKADQAGQYSVQVSNGSGSVISSSARLTVCSPSLEQTWKGRPWIPILSTDDPVPGSGSTFGPLMAPFNPLFTLRDKTVHVIARGDSDAANAPEPKTALVRWRDGVLSTLVFTNTPKPEGDGNFVYPYYPTEEGDGAVNFSHPSAMYEVRGGVVSAVLTTNTPVPGRPGATVLSPGSFARRGTGVVLSTTLETGSQDKPGALLFLNGNTLTRIADDTTDLPGVMTGYAYRLTEDSVNFDGNTIVFSTMTSLNGPGGVYRSTTDGVVTKLLDTQDLIPGLTNGIVSFGDVDVEGGLVFAVVTVKRGVATQNRIVKFEADGTAQAIAFGDYLVASGPRQVYFGSAGSIQRWTDGSTETVINNLATLGCQRVNAFLDVEAQGDDVVVSVEYKDGTAGLFANFGQPAEAPARIVAQPVPVATPETAPATFSVGVVGPGPFEYQWYKGNQRIEGATNAVFTLLSAGSGDVANYHAVITSGASTLTSSSAALSLTAVPPKPLLFVPPVSISVPIGSPAVLEASAAGVGPLTYTWSKSGTVVAEGPSRTLSFPATTAANHGTYSLVVSNPNGSYPAWTATLTVTPWITRQPESVTVAAGSTAVLSVEAGGFPELRYQWMKVSPTLLSLVGKTNATLEIPNAQAADAGQYQVNVSANGVGAVRSAVVNLVVNGGGGGGQPPVLSPVTIAGNQITFTLPTSPGQAYKVQTRTSLNGGDWTHHADVAGDGTVKTVSVPIGDGNRFVRAVTSP